MAADYSKYDIYIRSAPGAPFHEKWEAGPGGFRIFDLSGGGSRYFARLNSGVTHKDVFDAYTKGGTDHKGEKTAQAMVTKEPVIDPIDSTNPGYDGLGSRVSWGTKSGNKSSSEGSGKTTGTGNKKPVKKEKTGKKKNGGTQKNPGSDGEGSRGRDNSELDAARQRVEDARRKLEEKSEKVKQKADDAADALRSMQDLVDRLKKLVGDSSHVKRLLAQLRRAMLEASAAGQKIKTAEATAKNYRQLLQQNWLTDLRRRNGHHQPNPPFGKDMVSGDPVNLISGAFTLEQTDVSLPGRTFPLAVTRSYSNQIYCQGSFGTKWTAWFDANCRVMSSGAVYVWLGNGSGLWFLPDDDGSYRVPMGSAWKLTRKSKRFQLLNVEGASQEFDDDGRLSKIEDRFGNWTRISRNDNGQPTGLKNSTGRELTIKGWPVREVKDSSGRTWSYRYDSQNNLVQVTLPKTKGLPQGRSTFYEYAAGQDPRTWHNLKRIRDTGRELALENIYGTKPETFNRVIKQEAAGDTVRFRYEFLKTDIEDVPKNRQTATHRTTFTDTRGVGTTHEFNLWGQSLTMTHRPRTGSPVTLGQSWYDEDGNLTKVQRPRGNRLEFLHDRKNKDPLRRSNVVELRRIPAGSGSPLVTRMKYGDFNQVIEIQAPDGAVTTCQLGKYGLVQKVIHPAVTLETGPPVSAETKIQWNRYGQPVEFFDAAGRRTSIAYYSSGGGAGLPKKQQLNGKTTARFQYDTLGRLEESHDLAGVATVFEYDELDQLVKVSEPSILDSAVKYEYDPLGQLVSESVRNLDENGKARSPEWITGRYVYDRKGRVVSVEEMLSANESAVSKFAWDSEDNLVETRDPQGGIGRFEYDDFGQLVRNVANPGRKRHGREVATTFEYDENGNQTATVDALSLRTEINYDGHDRPLESTDTAGNVLQQKWDSKADRVISTKLIDKAGTLRGEQRVEHDELGRVVAERTRIILPDGSSPGWLKSKVHFDIAGQLRAMVDPLGNRSEFEYDTRGLLSTVRDAIGNVERMMYDERGLVTEQVSELVDGITPTKRQVFVQRSGYDDLGRTAWQQDGLGNRVVFQWDALNQLIATTAPDGTAERFEYDLAGRMTRQTHSDGSTSNWRFDSAGRLVDMTDPRGQITRLNYDDWHAPVSATLPDGSLLFENRFDAAGRVYESTDARGVKVRTKFDELSQPIEQTSLLRGNVEGITKRRFTWDAWGNLSSATNDSHSLQRISDSLGRLHRETTDGRSTEWTFGKNHLVSRVKYPEGFALEHDWDQYGRLKSLQPVWQSGGFIVPRPGSTGPLAEFDWLGAEMPQRYRFGNGLQTTSQIDAAGRLISQTTRDSAGKNVERITTLRDAAGQVRHMNRESLHATNYEYDQTGQLTEVREGKPASSADVTAWLPSADSTAPDSKRTQTDLTKLITTLGAGNSPQTTTTKFKYDQAGNREQLDRSGDGQTTRTNYRADSANRYTQIDGQLQKYDAAGNLIDDGQFQFRYDAFNQLVRVVDAQTGKDILKQSHDPLGRVSKRWIDGSEETLTWDDAELLQTESTSGTGSARTTSQRLFIPGLGIDEPIAEIDAVGTHFLHPDPMSSVVAVSDGKGSVTERFHFDAFGQQAGTFDAKFKPLSPSTSGRARFQGREQLGSLPYLDFRSRVYSPGHGRFLQTDPIGLAGDPNLYRFGLNNPLLYADPMGTDPVQRGMGGGGNGSLNPDAEFLRYMQRPSWGHSFLEGMMVVVCPFLVAAVTLQKLNSKAMAANRAGISRSYGSELFDLAKMIPILGGILGLGELGVHAAQGKPTPPGTVPKLLGSLTALLFMGGSGISSWQLKTPSVGGYGYAFKHAAFLNRLRKMGHPRRTRRLNNKMRELHRYWGEIRAAQGRIDVYPRGTTPDIAVPRGIEKYARGSVVFDPAFAKESRALTGMNVRILLDGGQPPRAGLMAEFLPVPASTGLAGIVTVYTRGLYAAAAETMQTFALRLVSAVWHEGWHARQVVNFRRAANITDELIAMEREYRILQRQRHGQTGLGPKPPAEWYRKTLESLMNSQEYGHLPPYSKNGSR